ncbi:MAG: hypothetical protein VR71_02960 [Roseovarius sp. BRH_c41]|nr:MAG: hypothetical protein VR71_02960 [Roseovarius sp. BRH_c41]
MPGWLSLASFALSALRQWLNSNSACMSSEVPKILHRAFSRASSTVCPASGDPLTLTPRSSTPAFSICAMPLAFPHHYKCAPAN